MKVWEISYPDEKYGNITECYTEDGIIKLYYDEWVQQMVKSGKYNDLTRQKCIDDWVTIHWATEIK